MRSSQDLEPVYHVAVVDDDASVRRALARLLGAYFFTVRTYPSGLEFLESLESTAPDCLVLDLHMPTISGLEVLRRLSAGGFSFPVVILTAHDDVGVRSRCQLAGATTILAKPVTLELVRALTAVVGRPAVDVSQTDAA